MSASMNSMPIWMLQLCSQAVTILHPAGLSKEKDDDGFHTYRRPEGKSGGHGVGWSEIPVYTFKVRL